MGPSLSKTSTAEDVADSFCSLGSEYGQYRTVITQNAIDGLVIFGFRTKEEIEATFADLLPNTGIKKLHLFSITTRILELIQSNRNVDQPKRKVDLSKRPIFIDQPKRSVKIENHIDTNQWVPTLLLEAYRSRQYIISSEVFRNLNDSREISWALQARLHEDHPKRVFEVTYATHGTRTTFTILDMSFFPHFAFKLSASEDDPTLLVPLYSTLPQTIYTATAEERPELNCFYCTKRDSELARNKFNCIELAKFFILTLLRRATETASTSFISQRRRTLSDGTTISVYFKDGRSTRSVNQIFSMKRGCLFIDNEGAHIFQLYFSPHYVATVVPTIYIGSKKVIEIAPENEHPDAQRFCLCRVVILTIKYI